MAVEAYIPTLSIVVVTALIDSINPCAIGVLILMLSVLLAGKKSIKRMMFLGSLYILAVFTVYLLAGFGLMYFLSSIPLYVTEYLSIIVGVLIIIAGLLEIKDYFWYGRGFSLAIPVYFSRKLEAMSEKTTVVGIILLGAFVSAVELPCTGAPYLAIITLLSANFDIVAFWMLILYNILFVSPLIVILVLVGFGKKLYDVNKWKQDNKHLMRLAVGLLLIGLGWMLILIANGTLNFG